MVNISGFGSRLNIGLNKKMKPLSVTKRRVYFFFFAIAFVLLIPVLILYSTGYRLDSALGLIRTGGLYISVPYSGVNVYINDEIVRQTGVFQKNVFVQNLKPDNYSVRVEKDELQVWTKQLEVFPKTVTEAYSFMLPQEILFSEIKEFVELATTTATTTMSQNIPPTRPQKNPLYVNAMELFVPATTTPIVTPLATTTEDIKIKRKLLVENQDGTLSVSWTGDLNSRPHYFCVDDNCKKEIIINTPSKVRTFDFFPGRDDLLIVALSDGVFVIEVDDRSSQNIQTVMLGKGLNFRFGNNDILYIKDGIRIFFTYL